VNFENQNKQINGELNNFDEESKQCKIHHISEMIQHQLKDCLNLSQTLVKQKEIIILQGDHINKIKNQNKRLMKIRKQKKNMKCENEQFIKQSLIYEEEMENKKENMNLFQELTKELKKNNLSKKTKNNVNKEGIKDKKDILMSF
jgi:hypothetical protein